MSAFLHKKRIVLALAGTLAGCATTTAPDAALRGEVELQSTRCLLAWLIEGSPLPGHDKEPGTAWAIDQADRILVVCDYFDHAVPLSSDPRVMRPTPEELDAVWRRHAYDRTVYVWISLIPRYTWSADLPEDHVALSLKYSFGNAGMHRFEFGFWQDGQTLRAAGFLVGSS